MQPTLCNAFTRLAALIVLASTSCANALSLTGVQARVVHGLGVGTLDLPVDTTRALTGPVTVEPRAIGPGYAVVFQFDEPITSVSDFFLTDESGIFYLSGTASRAGNEVIVTSPVFAEGKRLALTVRNVNGTGRNASAAIAFLAADTRGSGSIAPADIVPMKSRSGQAVGITNVRFDINESGAIGASDILGAKGRSGRSLPAASGYAVGGTISGLQGPGVLRLNGVTDRVVDADGPFLFASPLPNGAPYTVTVDRMPASRTCTVTNGAGTIAGAEASVSITCDVAPGTIQWNRATYALAVGTQATARVQRVGGNVGAVGADLVVSAGNCTLDATTATFPDGGNADTTVTVTGLGPGVCTLSLANVTGGAAPGPAASAIVTGAGCPIPPDDMLAGTFPTSLGVWFPAAVHYPTQIFALPLPAFPGNGLPPFGHVLTAGTATTASLTGIEVSASPCAGDMAAPGACHQSRPFMTLSFSWTTPTGPFGNDQATADLFGYCWIPGNASGGPGDASAYFLNVRYAFQLCPFDSGCGVLLQRN
jgi:hypothetical protein